MHERNRRLHCILQRFGCINVALRLQLSWARWHHAQQTQDSISHCRSEAALRPLRQRVTRPTCGPIRQICNPGRLFSHSGLASLELRPAGRWARPQSGESPVSAMRAAHLLLVAATIGLALPSTACGRELRQDSSPSPSPDPSPSPSPCNPLEDFLCNAPSDGSGTGCGTLGQACCEKELDGERCQGILRLMVGLYSTTSQLVSCLRWLAVELKYCAVQKLRF